ncbi:MAG: hypothetical protein AAB074_00345 [Planctomycetota bacterium]
MFSRWLTAAAFTVALDSVSIAEDCANCKDGKVCLSHEAGDDIAIKEADIKFKTKDMMGKREAIHSLEAAQLKHMNVRSKKITMSLAKALADSDVDVKMLAAEKISTLGDPVVAVQGLKSQTAYYKKLIGTTKPKKEKELPAWESNLKLLTAMYDTLGVVKDPAAAGPFVEDLTDTSPFVAKAAADATGPFKGNKEIIRELWAGLNKWLGPSQQVARPEGSFEAFIAMSQALEKLVDDPPKGLSGKTQPQQMSLWNPWWRANEAKYK